MARRLPPPDDRFDPITARWLTPGGPLHDPERGDIDPDETVTLVGPIPRELAALGTGSSDAGSSTNPYRRFRWALLIVLAIGILGLLVSGMVV
ncbi:MAG: hypothetical protein LCH96_07705 [Actinobacteria bacterium]|nr:hypothetical protein [Actinomycetota bacterium]